MQTASQVSRAVEQYGDMVRRICFLYLKSDSDAQDAFQDIFLRYMEHSGDFAGAEHEKAWLARVAVNRCKDVLKSFFRSRVTCLEEVDAPSLALPPEHSDVYDAVLSLPEQYKSVVYLHYYEGYSAVEIARILRKKENTVYTWLARARKLLQVSLGGDGYGG